MSDNINNFTNSIILLVKLFSGLKDKFLTQKLHNKISALIGGYIKLSNFEGEDEEASTSHNVRVRDLLNTCDSLLDFLDYVEHSKLTSTTPLLYARKNLLNFKLEIVRSYLQLPQRTAKPKEPKASPVPNFPAKPKNIKDSSNKERIFNFIKHSPNSRTKDIIDEFSVLSQRTVKRNLKELTRGGFLRKWSKDNAVYYSVL